MCVCSCYTQVCVLIIHVSRHRVKRPWPGVPGKAALHCFCSCPLFESVFVTLLKDLRPPTETNWTRLTHIYKNSFEHQILYFLCLQPLTSQGLEFQKIHFGKCSPGWAIPFLECPLVISFISQISKENLLQLRQCFPCSLWSSFDFGVLPFSRKQFEWRSTNGILQNCVSHWQLKCNKIYIQPQIHIHIQTHILLLLLLLAPFLSTVPISNTVWRFHGHRSITWGF